MSNPPAIVAEDRTISNSDPPMHTDGTATDSLSLSPVTDNIPSNTVPLPLISAKDYTDDVKFSGMYQYLFDGTLSSNAKKDKPILLMEDKYIIDDDDLLYRVDTP